ncbi:MAG: DUF1476 domain-containing protein [Sphingomonadales bacterium]|jgi:hypothetical protein
MSTFDERESAFENRFAHDAETRFRILARRDKLVGLWAAAKLGKAGDDADAYAKQVILSDLEKPGDDDIIAKLVADLGVDSEVIKAELASQLLIAEAQISGAA